MIPRSWLLLSSLTRCDRLTGPYTGCLVVTLPGKPTLFGSLLQRRESAAGVQAKVMSTVSHTYPEPKRLQTGEFPAGKLVNCRPQPDNLCLSSEPLSLYAFGVEGTTLQDLRFDGLLHLLYGNVEEYEKVT